jgi:acyl-homoserine-lactone acylase
MKFYSLLPKLTAILLLLSGLNAFAGNESEFPKIDAKNVTIVRDSFGIPHIFGKTDAEVAYGLAWANAEDAFPVTQQLVLASKALMGRKEGIEGAKTDFFVHAIGARELVNEHFDKDLSTEFKKYLDGYVQGVNAYAAAHPNEVQVKGTFPVTSKDIVTAYVVIMSALSWTPNNIGDAVSGKYDQVPLIFPEHKTPSVGSNAFALNSTKTVDGRTIVCINPHLQMEGQLSFYEAQLCSEEGLNMEGCMFQGSTSLAMGVNENLGWGMTWNTFDKVDVFKLKMNPKKKLEYEFDGQWVKLEKKPVWLKVGLGKHHKFVLPVKKMTYWSKYGATVKSMKSDNYYSIRFPANTTIRTGEQLYRMNKAKGYKEYWDAIRIHAITLFNIVYADKDDNIFYIHHGMMPERDTTYDWSGIVPGNTSKTLWTKLVPLDSMPLTINPSCGYVYNTNNTPFHASSVECNESGYCYVPRKLMDERPGDNNRAERFKEQIEAKPKFSLKDLHDLKFDVTLSKNGKFAESVKPFFSLDEKKYPDIKEAIGILKSWNRVSEINECAPTLFGLVLDEIFKKYHYDDAQFVSGFTISEEEWVSNLRKACDTLKVHFGTVKVEWGKVHRNIRGNVDLPLRGFADMLSPSYPKRMPGKFVFKPEYGDTYTMFGVFGKNGLEQLQALQPCGNSLNPASKHYNDQIELFSKQQMRPLSLKKEEVMKRADKIYHPE